MARSVIVTAEHFALARPFRIARGVKSAIDVVTVCIHEDGITGRGEGVPYPRYGESPASALAAIAGVRPALEQGATRRQLLQLLPAGAARNAVDCALWDLELKRAGTSIWDRLGQTPPRQIATAITISLDTPDNMALAAGQLRDAALLKVKLDRHDPASRLRAVRAAAPGPELIVDPNESWTMAEVRELQPLLAELRIGLLEQPLPAEADSELQGFQPLVPIAADESVHTARDLPALIGRYQAINIKLDKAGGLTAALELADATAKAGLQLMVGCMVSTSLSIAPALPIATRARFVDLDGPWWLAADRAGGVTCEQGMLSLPAAGFWG